MVTTKGFLIAFCVFILGSLMTVSGHSVTAQFCSGKVDGDYRHPSFCDEHVKCSNGNPHVFQCPASTLWDDSKKRCEHMSDLPSCNGFSCTGRPDGSYPNPAACTSYYVCVAENAHFMPCPATTHYDPALKVCDHATNVACSTSPTGPPTM